MPKQRVESYIAFPAIIPYRLLSFLGFMFKWFVLIICAVSIPFSLYSCYRIIERVAHNPKSITTTTLHRQHTLSNPKGQRP